MESFSILLIVGRMRRDRFVDGQTVPAIRSLQDARILETRPSPNTTSSGPVAPSDGDDSLDGRKQRNHLHHGPQSVFNQFLFG